MHIDIHKKKQISELTSLQGKSGLATLRLPLGRTRAGIGLWVEALLAFSFAFDLDSSFVSFNAKTDLAWLIAS